MTDDDTPPPTLNLSGPLSTTTYSPWPRRLVYEGRELFVDQRPLTVTCSDGQQRTISIPDMVVNAICRWEDGDRVEVEQVAWGKR